MSGISRKRLIGVLVWLAVLLTAAGCAVDTQELADLQAALATPAAPTNGSGHLAAVAPVEPAAAAPAAEAAPIDASTTEATLAAVTVPQRDLRELAMRLKPGVDDVPATVATARDYQVGDTLEFWAHDLDNNQDFQITAELVYITDAAYVWVESGRDYDYDAVVASVERFSEQSYPAEVAFFGSEWKPGVDLNPRVHILHVADIGTGIAGYYSSADQYTRAARERSNEKEMFYINLTWLNQAQDYNFYETVLAHEFQHMIHWANDRNEETWLNEGLSEFAQEVAGYPPDTIFARNFMAVPDTQLNTWNDSNASNAEHYGSAYLFVRYFSQRFGPELTRALVAHKANGLAGITATLADAGIAMTGDDLFADWVVANFVDDPAALGETGVYGYDDIDPGHAAVDRTITRLPAAGYTATVNNYATDYIALEARGDLTVEFDGETMTKLADTEPFSGEFAWWSNRGDDSDTRLTRTFDFSNVAAGSPILMDVTMWWHIEEDYDYGYVLVSRDGAKWEILPGQRTTDANPSGNSYGHGYTARSGDDTSAWVVEQFDLSAYAGEQVQVRFEYVTDDAVTKSGWFIDDIAIPAIDYATDFEQGADGWESEGWLLTDNRLPQRWLLQLMTFKRDELVDVQRIQVDADGRAVIPVSDLDRRRNAVLAVSALAPITTEPAVYALDVRAAD
ncbi:MAG: immune inhibitor A [Caldilineaceae bacterium]